MRTNICVFKLLLFLTASSVFAFPNSIENIEDNEVIAASNVTYRIDEDISANTLTPFSELLEDIKGEMAILRERVQKIEEEQETQKARYQSERLLGIFDERGDVKDEPDSPEREELQEKSSSERSLMSRLDAIQVQLDENTSALKVLTGQLEALNNSALHKVNARLQEVTEIASMAINCVPFGDLGGVHQIEVADFGQFDVLCDGQTAGPGWIVVQRRFDGSENFRRSWSMYSEGFGDLNGEFFIGLEKLHRLTKSLPYELYIELVAFDGETRFARYDNFLIGSEEEEYMLKSLGTYSGNAGNALSYNLHDSFTTFDRDNDGWGAGNCADWYKSGWWFNLYGNSNLNGLYFHREVNNEEVIWWYPWKGYDSLQSVKMLIRPKYSAL